MIIHGHAAGFDCAFVEIILLISQYFLSQALKRDTDLFNGVIWMHFNFQHLYDYIFHFRADPMN